MRAERAPPDDGSPYFLFDLEVDLERNDLSAEQPEPLAALVARADELGATAYQTTHKDEYRGMECVDRAVADRRWGGAGRVRAAGKRAFSATQVDQMWEVGGFALLPQDHGEISEAGAVSFGSIAGGVTENTAACKSCSSCSL